MPFVIITSVCEQSYSKLLARILEMTLKVPNRKKEKSIIRRKCLRKKKNKITPEPKIESFCSLKEMGRGSPNPFPHPHRHFWFYFIYLNYLLLVLLRVLARAWAFPSSFIN